MSAGTKFTKDSKEWAMFTDYWKLCQELWQVEDTEEYWTHAIEQAQSFYKRYDTMFARSLSNALLDELERKLRGE